MLVLRSSAPFPDGRWYDSRTNSRMADDRFPVPRLLSIEAMSSEMVVLRDTAISLSRVQKASSRLTLVLRPPSTVDRLSTVEIMSS